MAKRSGHSDTSQSFDEGALAELRRAVETPAQLLLTASAVLEAPSSDAGAFGVPMPTPEQSVEGFARIDDPATTALLAVVATLCSEDLMQGRIATALAQRTHGVPTWVQQLSQMPVHGTAVIRNEAGDDEAHLIDIELADEAITFGVLVDHNCGSTVHDAIYLAGQISENREEIEELWEGEIVDADPAWLRARGEQMLDSGDAPCGSDISEVWPLGRPLWRWLLHLLPEGSTVEVEKRWDDQDLVRLSADFLNSEHGAAHADETDRILLSALLDFGAAGPQGPLAWSPTRVEIVLTEWFPAAVRGPAERLRRFPALLRSYLRYAFTRNKLSTTLRHDALAAVDLFEPTFLNLTADPFDFIDQIASAMMPSAGDAVGGADALAAIDAEPLPDEPFDFTGVAPDIVTKVTEMVALCDLAADKHLDVEHRTAMRRLLRKIVLADPDYFRGRAAARTSAAAVGWMVAHANDTIGYDHALRTSDLMEAFGAKANTNRVDLFRRTLGLPTQQPTYAPTSLADPDLLVSRRRAALIALRDGQDVPQSPVKPPKVPGLVDPPGQDSLFEVELPAPAKSTDADQASINALSDHLQHQIERWVPSGLGPSQRDHIRNALIAEAHADTGPLRNDTRPLRVRREPLPPGTVLRVRVDLDRARPPIWRRLDVRADITLDVLHGALLAIGGWDDDHLHEFWIGDRSIWGGAVGERYVGWQQQTLDGGLDDEAFPEDDVRLDELLQKPGDKLHYEYDFGASWRMIFKVEKVLAVPHAPAIECLGGRTDFPDEFGGSAPFDRDALNRRLARL